jgi:hypothetical protein
MQVKYSLMLLVFFSDSFDGVYILMWAQFALFYGSHCGANSLDVVQLSSLAKELLFD